MPLDISRTSESAGEVNTFLLLYDSNTLASVLGCTPVELFADTLASMANQNDRAFDGDEGVSAGLINLVA